MTVPKTTKAVIVREAKSQNQLIPDFKNDAVLRVDYPLPELGPGKVLVKVAAVGFNHKDVWIRKGMYPRLKPESIFGGDGAGVVVASHDDKDDLINKRVFLVPSSGWKSKPTGPEDPKNFQVLGCRQDEPSGTFAEYLVVDREQLIRTPDHLDDIQAAAWPLGGITAWRAAMINAGVQAGHNVLITGIGGGVALFALQFCVAAGANVYVTSGKTEKIQKAIELGAKGGVNYKDENWPAQLQTLLNKQGEGTKLDSVVDGAGGEILGKIKDSLQDGGRVVWYGMGAGPTVTMHMEQVLHNQQLIGSTMGSHKDMEDATAFISKHKIVPIVSHVIEGLDKFEQGFELLYRSDQFGKVIIKV
ncbi:hypothetical protein CC1G_02530 [Coprinopsis cinerea okayama7|uniref:Enoyl reductase (ER) domain-containing protein n=1 Tax=Coprinopsis cinerea (strain Okayama-7 / 130 / ATCC MYA-4618 / FGSC 9003) TaxID=240176 RepID=A8NBS0_COPC7|nr:hypothetical protein CC1G_02530 [Coprinopsis cinerea okayama7\|eukprot:XP_001832268.1 hypothetical protein CC1G_02530 [Coprinopsis cinerea okayama7\